MTSKNSSLMMDLTWGAKLPPHVQLNPQACTAHISLAKAPVMRKGPYAGMLVNGAGQPMNLEGCAPTPPASMGGNKTPIVDQRALEEGCEN